MRDDFCVGTGLPEAAGLYDPTLERDSCGVGFLVDLTGTASHATVSDALHILQRMSHRGADSFSKDDCCSGDGAGILLSIPHEFFANYTSAQGLPLPPPGHYGVGSVFLLQDANRRNDVKRSVEDVLTQCGLSVICWRHVPTDNRRIGNIALSTEPRVEQLLVRAHKNLAPKALEVLLYLARKRVQNRFADKPPIYFCSFSCKTLVYKGQLTPEQLSLYYPDLSSPQMKARMAMVHSRFSTNTFPSWERAQPLRSLCHNGEINTLRGNLNWMSAREGTITDSAFGEALPDLFPIIEKHSSDSGSLDNVLEFLCRGGREILESALMMIPEAWQNDIDMDEEKRAFYEFHSMLMEPWDGPALVAFTDGDVIGCVLDRNGLRPGRYYVTRDDRVICASEVGVLEVAPEDIVKKGRLYPGRVFAVDLERGRVVDDNETKRRLSRMQPYSEWLLKHKLELDDIEIPVSLVDEEMARPFQGGPFESHLRAFGYTSETLEMLLGVMAADSYEALGSMGNDVPLACMSSLPRPAYDYFKQMFAQVTNPPIDPIRETIVTSLQCPIGAEGNLMNAGPLCASRVNLRSPILDAHGFLKLLNLPSPQLSAFVIDTTFSKTRDTSGSVMVAALAQICKDVESAIEVGNSIIVLSDRATSNSRVPINALIVVGAVHQHLVSLHLRTRVALICESGDAREVHQFSTLFGFGADAVYPYLAIRSIFDGKCTGNGARMKTQREQLVRNYIKAAHQGITKVMAKMGISTLQSYKGAQVFEALGIADEVMSLCFRQTHSRIGGVGFDVFVKDAVLLHDLAFPASLSLSSGTATLEPSLPLGLGEFHYRSAPGAEIHVNDPSAIAALQQAARGNDRAAMKRYTELANRLTRQSTLRGLLRVRFEERKSIPLEDVESASLIVRRFCTGAMSFGSISRPAHTTLAIAMNRIGGKSNTGEGGEEEDRWHPSANGDSMRSAIKQVASGRFGVTAAYLSNADEIQIKIAQGAKPGEGGELPGLKVQGNIARARHSTPGVGLISPPPHHDIYSIEDLAQLIYDLKSANNRARISVKLVSEVGVGVVAAGVAKCKAEHILISGHDGGTGASRWTGIKHAGVPWELGLAETHQTLVMNGLRDRVVLQTDGQLRTGLDVLKAAMLGADEFGFATAPLIALGCIMMRKCHLNSCPVGIATQDPVLVKKFAGQPEHVVNFMFMLAEQVREHLAALGLRSFSELIGRSELLATDTELAQSRLKTRGIDLSRLVTSLSRSRPDFDAATKTVPQHHNLDAALDTVILARVSASLESGGTCSSRSSSVVEDLRVQNTDRAVGAQLSREITRRCGVEGLPDGTITVRLRGSAGQSFGAWLTRGVSLLLEGEANDYVGKGLSGGCIAVFPHPNSAFVAHQSIIVGNVALYGATSGRAFFAGVAAERFAVRNSGAVAVVEGAGDHALEYMTRGTVVILGEVGRNFAAGMSGGIGYVLTEDRALLKRRSRGAAIELVELDDDDRKLVYALVEEHVLRTQSALGSLVLKTFADYASRFVKVFPLEYRRALERAQALQLSRGAALPSNKPREENGNAASIAGNQNAPEGQQKKKQQLQDILVKDLKDIEDIRPSSVAIPNKRNGFLRYSRESICYREPKERVDDYEELQIESDESVVKTQAARCMDCGVPFCHQEATGCPLNNRIPEWNTLVHRGQWREALHRLLETNNFPEFTGRVCPAPCETACVLGIIDEPVAIKSIELAIIDRAFANGWMRSRPCRLRSGRSVAVIGSGPAGLAVADQLNRVYGHAVTVYERADRIGGLLMYGVPNMKLGKVEVLQRRVSLMEEEGVKFCTGVHVGKDGVAAVNELRTRSDAVVLATGSTRPRDLPIAGRELRGVYFAMDYLQASTRSVLAPSPNAVAEISARGKRVIVIGGGDTGNDCIGTAMRQGATAVVNFELMPQPPAQRADDNPWPQWAKIFRVDYGHAEVNSVHGDDPRQYCVLSKAFVSDDNGAVRGVESVRVKWRQGEAGRWLFDEVKGSRKVFKADLVLLAMGFLGPETSVSDALGIELSPTGNYKASYEQFETSQSGVFACGDCRRGQSLVVWAIAEGRRCATQVDKFLASSDRC